MKIVDSAYDLAKYQTKAEIMTDQQNPFLKSFEWLEENLSDKDLRIIDASWFLPAQNRDPIAEFETAHIPNAIFFDQDEIVDPESNLPHPLPDPDTFAKAVGKLGISEENVIVVYDAMGMITAPRIWWMFKIMGARSVYVLDGGFDEWKAKGLPISSEKNPSKPTTFTPYFDKDAVSSIDDVLAAIGDEQIQILDARAAGRFNGSEAEPRAGMRSGHMPSAINTPVLSLSENGKLKSISDLKALFESKSVAFDKQVITTCGSGVTAAVITLALNSIGHTNVQLYDGSWSEWGGRDDTPIETSTDDV